MYRNSVYALIAISAALGAVDAAAEDFSVNNLNYLVTNKAKPDPIYGYGTEDEHLQTFQFEHFGGTGWGDIYIDAEMYRGDDVGTPFSTGNRSQSLIVVNPRLSLSKIAGRSFAFGPVSDVSLIARWEVGSYPDTDHFRSRNYGVSLNFNVPGFDYFESGLLYRDTNFDSNTWLWRSVLLSKPIDIGRQKWHFNVLSLVNGSNNNGTEVFERVDILWEIAGNPKYQLGTRLEYARYANNPLAPGNYRRFTPQLMLKFTL